MITSRTATKSSHVVGRLKVPKRKNAKASKSSSCAPEVSSPRRVTHVSGVIPNNGSPVYLDITVPDLRPARLPFVRIREIKDPTTGKKTYERNERFMDIDYTAVDQLAKLDRSSVTLPKINPKKIQFAKKVVNALKNENIQSLSPRVYGMNEQLESAYKKSQPSRSGFSPDLSQDIEMYTLIILLSCKKFNSDGMFATLPGGLLQGDDNLEEKIRTIGRYFIGEIKNVSTPSELENINNFPKQFRKANLDFLLGAVSARDIVKISYPEYCVGDPPLIRDWLVNYRDPQEGLAQDHLNEMTKRLIYYEIKHGAKIVTGDNRVNVADLNRVIPFLNPHSNLLGYTSRTGPRTALGLVIPSFKEDMLETSHSCTSISQEELLTSDGKIKVFKPDVYTDTAPVVYFRNVYDPESGKNKRVSCIIHCPIDASETERISKLSRDQIQLPTITKWKKDLAAQIANKLPKKIKQQGVSLDAFTRTAEEIYTEDFSVKTRDKKYPKVLKDDKELLALVMVSFKTLSEEACFPTGFQSDSTSDMFIRVRTAVRLFVEEGLRISNPKGLENVDEVVDKLTKSKLRELIKYFSVRSLFVIGYPEFFAGEDPIVKDFAISSPLHDQKKTSDITQYEENLAKRAFYWALLHQEVINDGCLDLDALHRISMKHEFGDGYNRTLLTLNDVGNFGNGIKLIAPGFDAEALASKKHSLSSAEIATREAAQAQRSAERTAAQAQRLAERTAQRRAAQEQRSAERTAQRTAAQAQRLAERTAQRRAARAQRSAERTAERKAAQEQRLAERTAKREAERTAARAQREAEKAAVREQRAVKEKTLPKVKSAKPAIQKIVLSPQEKLKQKLEEKISNSFSDELGGMPKTCQLEKKHFSIFSPKNSFRVLTQSLLASLRIYEANNNVSLVRRVLEAKKKDSQDLVLSDDGLKDVITKLVEQKRNLNFGLNSSTKNKLNAVLQDLSNMSGNQIREILLDADKNQVDSNFPGEPTYFELLDYLIGYTAGLDILAAAARVKVEPEDLDPGNIQEFITNLKSNATLIMNAQQAARTNK